MQNKTKIFLITVAVFGTGVFIANQAWAEATVPWCCVDSVGKNCNQITSTDKCAEGLTLQAVACSTISTCPQYVAPVPATTPGAGITFPTNTGLPTNTNLVKGIFINIANFLLGIIGIIALISFVISGVQYFLVATDEKMLETAKKTMMTSIVGIAVALFGYIAVRTVEAILRG